MLTAPRHLLVDRGNSPLSVPVQHWAPLRTFLNSVVWAEAALSPPPGVDGLCMVLRDGEEILPGGCSGPVAPSGFMGGISQGAL